MIATSELPAVFAGTIAFPGFLVFLHSSALRWNLEPTIDPVILFSPEGGDRSARNGQVLKR